MIKWAKYKVSREILNQKKLYQETYAIIFAKFAKNTLEERSEDLFM